MALLPTTIIVFVLFLKAAWASHQCSWDPLEAVLQCSLEWQKSEAAALSFSKHQREATSVLKISCVSESDSTGGYGTGVKKERKRLTVSYEGDKRRGGRENNFWPHLQSLHIQDCPLNAIEVVLKGHHQNRYRSDILHDVIKPLLGGRSLSGLRHLALIHANTRTADRGQADFSSSLWCEV